MTKIFIAKAKALFLALEREMAESTWNRTEPEERAGLFEEYDTTEYTYEAFITCRMAEIEEIFTESEAEGTKGLNFLLCPSFADSIRTFTEECEEAEKLDVLYKACKLLAEAKGIRIE